MTDYAIKEWESIIKLAPEYPTSYYSLGYLYEEKKEYSKAIENFELFLKKALGKEYKELRKISSEKLKELKKNPNS